MCFTSASNSQKGLCDAEAADAQLDHNTVCLKKAYQAGCFVVKCVSCSLCVHASELVWGVSCGTPPAHKASF